MLLLQPVPTHTPEAVFFVLLLRWSEQRSFTVLDHPKPLHTPED